MQLLKLGGSVITKKDRPHTEDMDAIRSLAQMLGRVWKSGIHDIVLVHGAGSFGHALVIEHKLNDGVKTDAQKLAACQTRVACGKLSAILANALIEEGVPAIILPTGTLAVSTNRRLIKFDEKKVLNTLAMGYLPILRGDMVPDTALGMSVCSGDQLVARLGKKSERIVLGTNVDGVMADGKVVPLISSQNFAKFEAHLGNSSSPDVTGGMAGKIKELLEGKVSAYVANARHPERLEALLAGKKALCTQIEW